MSPVIKPLLLLEYTAKFPAVKKLLQNWWRVSAELPPQLREQARSKYSHQSLSLHRRSYLCPLSRCKPGSNAESDSCAADNQ